MSFLDGLADSLGSVDDAVAALSLARRVGERPRGVRVMTAHAAKGREFEHAFVAGFEEGLFPINSNPGQVREERCLAFVECVVSPSLCVPSRRHAHRLVTRTVSLNASSGPCRA